MIEALLEMGANPHIATVRCRAACAAAAGPPPARRSALPWEPHAWRARRARRYCLPASRPHPCLPPSGCPSPRAQASGHTPLHGMASHTQPSLAKAIPLLVRAAERATAPEEQPAETKGFTPLHMAAGALRCVCGTAACSACVHAPAAERSHACAGLPWPPTARPACLPPRQVQPAAT